MHILLLIIIFMPMHHFEILWCLNFVKLHCNIFLFVNLYPNFLNISGVVCIVACSWNHFFMLLLPVTAFDIQISGLTQETLHTHNENDKLRKNSYNALEAPFCGFNAEETVNEIEANKPTSKESLIKNWPLMSSIIVFCVFSLHDMAYSEVCLSLSFRFWNIS